MPKPKLIITLIVILDYVTEDPYEDTNLLFDSICFESGQNPCLLICSIGFCLIKESHSWLDERVFIRF